MKKKRLEFQANISDITPINPLFSTCKVRVLYTGKNRNYTILTKEAVENALPSLKNIPIVGEFSVEAGDFKGHGGAIDLDSFKFIHTTKPYGVVPESATYEWEAVTGKDGVTREYLTIHGCYLWTGRYEEALSVIEKGKGQSMEIEVLDGQWVEEEEAYQINNFVFSALCILGDNVEPCFEDASITAYSLDKESFKQEFAQMLKELKFSLSKEKEVEKMDELLKKYSITVEDLKEKGIDFKNLSEDELEAKIKEVFEVETPEVGADEGDKEDKKDAQEDQQDNEQKSDEPEEPSADDEGEKEVKSNEPEKEESEEPTNQPSDEPKEDEYTLRIAQLESELQEVQSKYQALLEEVESLRSFKLEVEKAEHEAKAKQIFENFQLKDEDVEGIDIHSLSLDEIEEKCYAILGRKLAKKNFTKMNKEKDGGIRLPISGSEDIQDKQEKPYGDLFERYKNK